MINTDYKDNQRFIHTFNKVFDEEMAGKIFKDGHKLWNIWEKYTDKHAGKFISHINIHDKIALYNWIDNKGCIELVIKSNLCYNKHFDKKLTEHISKDLCLKLFENLDVWDLWERMEPKSVEKLLDLINIKYKCKLFILI